jgi:hypothetical protein
MRSRVAPLPGSSTAPCAAQPKQWHSPLLTSRQWHSPLLTQPGSRSSPAKIGNGNLLPNLPDLRLCGLQALTAPVWPAPSPSLCSCTAPISFDRQRHSPNVFHQAVAQRLGQPSRQRTGPLRVANFGRITTWPAPSPSTAHGTTPTAAPHRPYFIFIFIFIINFIIPFFIPVLSHVDL